MVVPWMEAQNVAAGGAVGETAVPMKAGPDRKPAASRQAAPGRGFRAGCEGMVPKANLLFSCALPLLIIIKRKHEAAPRT